MCDFFKKHLLTSWTLINKSSYLLTFILTYISPACFLRFFIIYFLLVSFDSNMTNHNSFADDPQCKINLLYTYTYHKITLIKLTNLFVTS